MASNKSVVTSLNLFAPNATIIKIFSSKKLIYKPQKCYEDISPSCRNQSIDLLCKSQLTGFYFDGKKTHNIFVALQSDGKGTLTLLCITLKKWPNILEKSYGDHFVGLALKGLNRL